MEVALKIQRRRHADDAVDEISILQRLRDGGAGSPFLVQLYESFTWDGHVCMAFEKHGRSLESALDRGPLSPVRARQVTWQLLHAIAWMHRCGFTHTDVKPDNILYDPRTGSARLADLGSARTKLRQGARPGTREYLPPEVLIGSPLSPQMDLWSLGCTVFEMLTGHVLFSPRRVAAKKYREFSTGPDFLAVPRHESAVHDEQEEAAEQYQPGTVVAGKYRLDRVLGQGGFATVWSAHQLGSASLNTPLETLRAFAGEDQKSRAVPKTEQEERDEQWRREKGAEDLLDLALNYEHLLIMAAHFGPFRAAMVETAKYRPSYFEEDGALRFRPEVRPVPVQSRWPRGGRGSGWKVKREITDFLQQMMQIDPEKRPKAEELLNHRWLWHEKRFSSLRESR